MLEATGEGAEALITTVVFPATELHPLTVTKTEYIPASVIDTFATEGFCMADTKLFGPDQV